MSNSVSVAGWTQAQKLAFVHALWMHRKPAAFFSALPDRAAPSFSETEAKSALISGYIDYTSGRCIKVSTEGDEWDMTLYDRDVPAGGKTAAEIYSEVVAKK
jgi:hypothetical protein